MPDLQFVIVPCIYRNLPHEACIQQTGAVIDDLVHVLTNRDDHKRLSSIEIADRYRFEDSDRYEAVLRMNEDFIMPSCHARRLAPSAFLLADGTRLAADMTGELWSARGLKSAL